MFSTSSADFIESGFQPLNVIVIYLRYVLPTFSLSHILMSKISLLGHLDIGTAQKKIIHSGKEADSQMNEQQCACNFV
jgi:hypothetical protein